MALVDTEKQITLLAEHQLFCLECSPAAGGGSRNIGCCEEASVVSKHTEAKQPHKEERAPLSRE